MAEWIACIIAYNEEKLLPQCLDSIVGKVDRIIVVEGRIETFPGKYFYSQDRTLEVAHDYGCEVISASDKQQAWKDEAAMRSQYLLGEQDDWYLMIDADEKLMTPIPNIADLPVGINEYSLMINMIGDNRHVWRPRLFKHSGVMQYRSIHDALFRDGELISVPANTQRLHSVWFAHYQMIREAERRIAKADYYTNGYAHEPEFRKEWGMYNER